MVDWWFSTQLNHVSKDWHQPTKHGGDIQVKEQESDLSKLCCEKMDFCYNG